MTVLLLAYLGGVLTIVSPCILPVLPFVFARAGQPFLRSGLPMLGGMALAFAAVATLAAVGGSWAVEANQYGRLAAMALLALFGIALLFPSISDRLTRPLVALGGRLSQAAEQGAGGSASILPSLLLGVATGLLWAPCAGPILGLILTGAALQGANAQTSLLLLAYAAGAATSLALALLAGGKVFAAMKRSLGTGEWLRRGAGVAVLAAVVAIALGLDTGALARLSTASTTALEQGLLDHFNTLGTAPQPAPAMTGGGPAMMSANPAMMSANPAMMAAKPPAGGAELPIEGALPSLAGAVEWLNSPPLTTEGLKGKVVLIDFWTYSCINCLRAIPYVRAWAEKYKDQGLVVIGVHSPEFAFEKTIGNVRKAVADLKIGYPVAIDNDYAIWRAFKNQYWPAHYFIDAEGRIRHHHFGEGGYDKSEEVIQQLLAEAGKKAAGGLVAVTASGAEMASNEADVRSPETYLGYERAENFVSPGGAAEDASKRYETGMPRLNEWGLSGNWTIGKEHASLDAADGGITYRFHARDLHLVLGPGADGKPIRFRVTIDGAAPGESHGVDVDANGEGTVTEQRLYQLVRQSGAIADRSFEIRFLDPGVQAYAFTFG
ncbi:cytochrome c biogenesis protein DipZ [Bosea caraganae]|uniref:Cytochrome c biogenesis protein DipZ n=1 Tax=Bosea caraganae TaxID=2763117 RepID=A0A370L1B5_9HYPH|nr:cytochrome c biogenesis protein DipZ [Bosea caraganae]RDJ21308.1 cytochrome c biogenesis protein DipZ [Bosea caraganae]RDJ26448.1 cytochrome c biogenesis protein DipZ [Bosea caraganae]